MRSVRLVTRCGHKSSNLGGTWATLANSFLYQPATDLRYAWRFGNGSPRLMTQDTDSRLTQLSSPGIHGLTLSYFNTDTIQTITDNVYPSLNSGFTYDANDRLKTVARSGDAQGFDWDTVGNRTGHQRAGVNVTITQVANTNRNDAISGATSRTFGYDAAGNLTGDARSDGTRSFGYDSFNRLGSVPGVTVPGVTLCLGSSLASNLTTCQPAPPTDDLGRGAAHTQVLSLSCVRTCCGRAPLRLAGRLNVARYLLRRLRLNVSLRPRHGLHLMLSRRLTY